MQGNFFSEAAQLTDVCHFCFFACESSICAGIIEFVFIENVFKTLSEDTPLFMLGCDCISTITCRSGVFLNTDSAPITRERRTLNFLPQLTNTSCWRIGNMPAHVQGSKFCTDLADTEQVQCFDGRRYTHMDMPMDGPCSATWYGIL